MFFRKYPDFAGFKKGVCMNKYEMIAIRLNETATRMFKDFRAAQAKVRDAEEQVRKYSLVRSGIGANRQELLKKLQAEESLSTAKDELREVKKELTQRRKKLDSLKAELKAQLEERLSAKPEEIDEKTLKLLESGICTASEIARIYSKTESVTMRRLIGEFARQKMDGLEKALMTDSERSEARAQLSVVAQDALNASVSDRRPEIQGVESVLFTLDRFLAAPEVSKIPEYWRELTESPLQAIAESELSDNE